MFWPIKQSEVSNLLVNTAISVPSHDVVEDCAEEPSVSMGLVLGTARQRPRYVAENLNQQKIFLLTTGIVIEDVVSGCIS